jgi:hypothetical protein
MSGRPAWRAIRSPDGWLAVMFYSILDANDSILRNSAALQRIGSERTCLTVNYRTVLQVPFISRISSQLAHQS